MFTLINNIKYSLPDSTSKTTLQSVKSPAQPRKFLKTPLPHPHSQQINPHPTTPQNRSFNRAASPSIITVPRSRENKRRRAQRRGAPQPRRAAPGWRLPINQNRLSSARQRVKFRGAQGVLSPRRADRAAIKRADVHRVAGLMTCRARNGGSSPPPRPRV